MKYFFSNSTVNYILKSLLVLTLFWVLYHQIFEKEDLESIIDNFINKLDSIHFFILIIALFLVPINWGLETMKLKTLLEPQKKYSFFRLFKVILAGTAFSILTPNRLGEYGGRILLVQPEDNWKTTIATLIGSISQLFIIISIGLAGINIYGFYFLNWPESFVYFFFCFCGILIIFLYHLYYNISKVLLLIERINILNNIKRFLKPLYLLKHVSNRQLTLTLIFSTSRYFVYLLQYLLVLYFFDVSGHIILVITAISTIFLIQTSVPLPPILGFLARGQIAIQIIGVFTADQLSILSASYILFLINLSLPAILGLIFILQVNILTSIGYGKK